jgi:thiol-disulfide isomerase/thioredoxin
MIDEQNMKAIQLNETSLTQGFNFFLEKIKNYNSDKFINGSYFYVNIWSLGCKPCQLEMPILNNLIKKFNKHIVCIKVTSHSEKAVSSYLRNENLKLDSFIFLNDMNDFISGIYNEIGFQSQLFPLHVILDKKGNALAFMFGAFQDENSTTPLLNFINNLD